MRDRAPLSDRAWAEIDAEATRSLKHFLAARRLVDFQGPLGWQHSSVDLGRVHVLDGGPMPGTSSALRKVLPLVEIRTPFTVSRDEMDAAARGATDLDLDAVIEASRTAALAEDRAVFHGYEAAAIKGIAASSPYPEIVVGDDYSKYPKRVADAVAMLRAADISGPYAIALGARAFTGVTESTEHGGYPVLQHLREILGGAVVWAPSVDGAVVVSQRGGDYEMTVGEDFSVGYASHDAESVHLYIEESFTFRINTPNAAVHLAYEA
ncbi:MAG TPA: family 1 encapsulin nanocompartment shell protein [Ilumatobacteraceae bacterium]|jgi:uncharacterized linocin/CFP29 family protein